MEVIDEFEGKPLISSFVDCNTNIGYSPKTSLNSLIEVKSYLKFVLQKLESNSKYRRPIFVLFDQINKFSKILGKKNIHCERITRTNEKKYREGRLFEEDKLKTLLLRSKEILDYFIDNDILGLMVNNKDKVESCGNMFANLLNIFQICFAILFIILNLGIRRQNVLGISEVIFTVKVKYF